MKKEGSKEKVIVFPETAVSLIYRTQKSKDDKRKSPDPMIPYAMQCKKRQINITETDKFRDRMKTKVLEMS